jgi:hypothetical protein
MNKLLCLLFPFMICAQIGHAAVDPDSAVVQDFEKRVAGYLQLRKSLESKLPPLKPTSSPERISKHQHELAKALAEARKSASPGEIFTPPITAEIRRLVSMAMQAGGNTISQSLAHAEPVQLSLRINETYPADIPVQSTPPSLLLNLPPLPQFLEYRITGRDLILLDANAGLVVDIIENLFQ